jgi:hypothetical protein
MRLARFVRTSGLLLMVVLAGFGGGCGPGTQSPTEQAEANKTIKEYHKSVHQELNDMKKQGAPRRGAPRGPAGP